jgi:hypothetical protein
MKKIIFIKQNNYTNFINKDYKYKNFINDKELFDYIERFNRSIRNLNMETIIDFIIYEK